MQPVQTGRETAPVVRLASANHIDDNPPLELAGTDAEAQAAARPVAGSTRTELSGRTTAIPIASSTSPGSVKGQAAGPAPTMVLASPDGNPDASPDTESTSASEKQPLSAPLADPLKARAATTADATAAGEWNRASHAASPPPAVDPYPAAAMWSEAEPESMSGYSSGSAPASGATAGTAAGGTAADGEAADGDAAVSAPQPSRPATVQAAGPLAVPDVQAAAAGSDGISPMEAGTRLLADGKVAAAGPASSPSMETSRASMLPETDIQPPAELDLASDADAVYRPARPVTAESILVITQGLVKAFSGHALAEALTPLLSLSSLSEEFEPAPDGTQTMSKADQPHESFEGPNGTAAKMASPQQLVDEATLATKQASAAARAGQPAAEAADMQEQLQLALPLILPRDGMPLPYLTYPPTEQEPKREERKVREIAEVDEDGDGQQHPSGGHRPQDGDEDGEAEEAPSDAADLEVGHAADDGRANDLYWRMAGWS
jgi:hypothetical protein